MGVFAEERIAATVELGSGNVLSGLMKRISRSWAERPQILNVADPGTLSRTQEVLGI